MLNSPFFCLTSDLDWASDYALQLFLDLVGEFGVKPTLFATHESELLRVAHAKGQIEVGIHPNFLPGSSHGGDVLTVVDHLCRLFPTARTFRSHCYRDDTHVTREMVRRGFTFDSNLCLFLQANLMPLRHQSGLLRFPVFWEDDVHYITTGGDWNIDRYLPDITSPGLKIFNVHPFMVAANVPNEAYYQSVKQHIPILGPESIDRVRFKGDGVQTFLRDLLEVLSRRGERFVTLGELYETFVGSEEPLVTIDSTVGRHTVHTEQDTARYSSLTDAEKQDFVRREFEERNAVDPYATSRDYNMRELEIGAIARRLVVKGDVLDLGSGNGYTLISLASQLEGWRLLGVDFSQNLIAGAHTLTEQRRSDLRSAIQFLCADALEYLKAVDEGSFNYIITERFLQNLPSSDLQKSTIRDAYRALAPGGQLLMCEGSAESFERLNDLREHVGLARIPATTRENVTAIRFNDPDIERFLVHAGFIVKEKVGFSTYFIVARVLHPLLVAPQAPRFDARINDLARLIQMNVPFDPGYGSNVLWVCQKPGDAMTSA
jgi:SAM-dependent methyltransferase